MLIRVLSAVPFGKTTQKLTVLGLAVAQTVDPQLPAQNIFHRSSMADLCREVLKQSPRWFTVRQILDVMRRESPLVLAGFANPGASLSNALRSLQWQREVEARLGDGNRLCWRWIGRANPSRNRQPLPMNHVRSSLK